jgi:putative heme-binding domain-containing protein
VLDALAEAVRLRGVRPSDRRGELRRFLSTGAEQIRLAAVRLAGAWREGELSDSLVTLAAGADTSEPLRSAAFDSLLACGGGSGRPGLATRAMQQGDAARGELVYRRETMGCVGCHAIKGVGGKVGPDLGTIGASAPLDYIVESLLTPGAAVKEGYTALLVVTDDGRQHLGLPVSETETELVLRDAKGQEIRLAKTAIEERTSAGSMMPVGLTDPLSPGDLLDLIRFCAELGRSP